MAGNLNARNPSDDVIARLRRRTAFGGRLAALGLGQRA